MVDGMPTLPARPASLVFAAVLLATIGVSGSAAGIELLSVAAGTMTGAAIGAGIAGFGLACVFGAIGVFLLRRWGWWLGLASIAVGLGVQAWIQFIGGAGLDPVIGFGLVVWVLALGLLLAPSTRAAALA